MIRFKHHTVLIGAERDVTRVDSIQMVLLKRWSFSVSFVRKVYP